MSAAEITEHEDGYLVTCEAHGLWRKVDTGPHASNLQALHNRVDHADDTDNLAVDLSGAAALVVALQAELRQHRGDPRPTGGSTRAKKAQGRLSGALSVWEALTGLTGPTALALARELADAAPPIVAAVPPF